MKIDCLVIPEASTPYGDDLVDCILRTFEGDTHTIRLPKTALQNDAIPATILDDSKPIITRVQIGEEKYYLLSTSVQQKSGASPRS